MRTIQVASLPLDEVINDIANAFEITTEENYGEHKLTLPSNIGEGTIRGITFDGGLGIVQYECTFVEDTEIQFIVTEVHPLKFLYVISGSLYHRFANEEETHILHKFQNAIVASSDGNGHILNFKKNLKTCIYSLEIDRDLFQHKRSFYRDGMNAKMKHLFQDIHALEAFYYEGEYSLKMADTFKKIQDFEDSDFLHSIFMESIAYQTMVLQITQYLDDQRIEKNRTILRRKEIDGILKAVEYIDTHISTYKSIPELTSLTGLNSAKLQEGFKHLYNKTVNQYVFDARLNLAKDLLLSSDDSVSEIVYKMGLSSKSYFSSVFKEEFGATPSTFRKNNK
ncbi:MAG: AraC family transcriptional regulator [Aquaticitalea sp.]